MVEFHQPTGPLNQMIGKSHMWIELKIKNQSPELGYCVGRARQGHPSLWKRIADGKNMSCKHYTPCGCQSMCGKDCPCLQSETCCEKYCGCSKSCKNIFRDATVQRVGVGVDGAFALLLDVNVILMFAATAGLGKKLRGWFVRRISQARGRPMREHATPVKTATKILLVKSDVAGWGAFLKNLVNKNDYLGEYTGELMSHRDTDKRGKINDRANSLFLFDLNDQYVLDAYRTGDKLKFANHSSNPNCYAKVMHVAGDHRVGIFAKVCIEASEELFYDYLLRTGSSACIGPDIRRIETRRSVPQPR